MSARAHTPPTEVSITVDTEFSIAGHITYPDRFLPVGDRAVLCPSAHREEGLGFLLENLQRHGMRATFFVETLNHAYFGDAPMRAIVDRLLQAGQDVQLHVHPEWLRLLPSPAKDGFAPNGWCDGRSAEELHRVFSLATEVFTRWTGKRPDALRTGSLRSDRQVYRTTKELGIPLSSNIDLSAFRPKEQELHLLNGRHMIDGVLEVPVFTYRDVDLPGLRRVKSLQITSCAAAEMERVLWAARNAGAPTVVVLTHPFEFAKRDNFQYETISRNRVNQQRFVRLLRFLDRHSTDFTAVGFDEARDRWLGAPTVPEVHVSVPVYYTLGRMLNNKINDTIWAY